MTDLYEVIKHITEQKKRDGRHPTYALDLEMRAMYTGCSFEQEIKTLQSVVLITIGRTINQNYYKITEI